MRKAMIIGVLAMGAGLFVAAPASAEERTCRGTIGAVTVDNLRVPQGATCTLNGTHVKGTVKVQRGATLVERIKMLEEILGVYHEKPVDVSRARAELEKTRSDLAQAEADYRITLDFYRKTVAEGAEAIERISLLERMSKKYGRAGVDISEVTRELEELKKGQ